MANKPPVKRNPIDDMLNTDPIGRMIQEDDLREQWERAQYIDFLTKQDVQSPPSISFMRSGSFIPVGELSGGGKPSVNIEDRTNFPFVSPSMYAHPLEPEMFTSMLAKALGTPDVGKGRKK